MSIEARSSPYVAQRVLVTDLGCTDLSPRCSVPGVIEGPGRGQAGRISQDHGSA